MRLLSLDYDPVYGGDDTVRSSFAGDLSVFDFDVVIWDPAASLGGYVGLYSDLYMNLPSLSDHTSVEIQSDVARRRAEFVEFVNSGRTLIAIVRPPQQCYVATGSHDYSGSGRNRVTSRHVTVFDLQSALPVAGTTFAQARGTRIDFDGTGPMVDVLRKYKQHLAYQAVITDPPGTALAHVAGTDKVVGSIQRSKGGGHLILLPGVDLLAETNDEDDEAEPDQDDSDADIYIAAAPEFQTDLLAAVEQLSGNKIISRPAWAARYTTDEQLRLNTEVVKQQGRVESARAKLAKLQQQAEEASARDQLYLGTGRALELEVKAVLELLGGDVTEPPPGRDDWRVTFSEGDAVVEVKGVGKSAAEKHAAQLEKWVSGSLAETGKLPKGILVVNTWRDVPLSERTGEDFPKQMLPYCEGRQHCLVTGLQLFVIRADIEAHPERVEYWRKTLLQTSGQVVGCENWASVIHEMESEA